MAVFRFETSNVVADVIDAVAKVSAAVCAAFALLVGLIIDNLSIQPPASHDLNKYGTIGTSSLSYKYDELKTGHFF